MFSIRNVYTTIFLAIFAGALTGALAYIVSYEPQSVNTFINIEPVEPVPTEQSTLPSIKPIEISSPTISPTNSVVTKPPTVIKPEWIFVFTYSGSPLPDAQFNHICNEIRPVVISWIDRELDKYQKIKPFDTIKCLQGQTLLSGDILENGRSLSGEGHTLREPINDFKTISYLESKIPDLVNEKYVTVFHYVTPTNLEFANYEYSNKYDFEFITSFNIPSGELAFAPPVDGVSLVHEFMHKLGATDKYSTNPSTACLTNPATGQQYNGYDIMCHRVSTSSEGFLNPPLSELIISNPTMDEIKWRF